VKWKQLNRGKIRSQTSHLPERVEGDKTLASPTATRGICIYIKMVSILGETEETHQDFLRSIRTAEKNAK